MYIFTYRHLQRMMLHKNKWIVSCRKSLQFKIWQCASGVTSVTISQCTIPWYCVSSRKKKRVKRKNNINIEEAQLPEVVLCLFSLAPGITFMLILLWYFVLVFLLNDIYFLNVYWQVLLKGFFYMDYLQQRAPFFLGKCQSGASSVTYRGSFQSWS